MNLPPSASRTSPAASTRRSSTWTRRRPRRPPSAGCAPAAGTRHRWRCACRWTTLPPQRRAASRCRASACRPAFENLKWLKPVYAGDHIAYSGVVTARRLSRSRPDWGIVSIEFAGENQKGEPVFAMTGRVFVGCIGAPRGCRDAPLSCCDATSSGRPRQAARRSSPGGAGRATSCSRSGTAPTRTSRIPGWRRRSSRGRYGRRWPPSTWRGRLPTRRSRRRSRRSCRR